jgi:Protein of unknown function DUF104.
MTSTIQAHYDGSVIIPDEPVDLPVGQPLLVRVNVARTLGQDYDEAEKAAALKRFLSRTVQGPSIPEDFLRREFMYEGED